jgi:membrane-associated phospholipid phosphatase
MPEGASKALIGAGVLVVMLIATWYGAFYIGLFEHADRAILQGFTGLGHHPHVGGLANRIATLCDPKPYVYFCAIPVVVAIARRRLWVALAIVAILLGANVTTQLLKPLLAHPRASDLLHGPSASSWPSGHATAAMSLALACVLAASRRWRPFVAAMGAAFAIAVSYSFLTLAWHYPSDVFGGFLVAGIWTLLAVAAVFTANARRPQVAASELVQRLSIREALGPPSAALLSAIGLAVVVFVARPTTVCSYARAHEAFVVGASAIAALGLALATGVMLALRK